MATTDADQYSQLETALHIITQDQDFVIRVIEHEATASTEIINGCAQQVAKSIPKKVHVFKVARAIVSSSSEFFKKLLNRQGAFLESRQQFSIDIHEDCAEAMAVWFKLMHDSSPTMTSPDDAATFKAIPIKIVWEVLATAHKYGFDPTAPKCRAWFNAWYEANSQQGAHGQEDAFEFNRMLLFPCHTFDHALGFAAATKFLAYHADAHITEARPIGFEYDHLRLDSRVIQQLNAAKGRLRTVLHGTGRRDEGIYSPIHEIVKRAKCDCKEKSLFGYIKALVNTDVWPLEIACSRSSMDDILRGLGTFEAPERSNEGCKECQKRFGMIVRAAVLQTKTYFDGLCLDCMSISKPKFGGDTDGDYWLHARQHVNWDAKCRIHHKQPSWYFSFMGRWEKMIKWKKEQARKHEY